MKDLKSNSHIKQNIKILYLYDYEGWAIHNVGKLWLDNNKSIEVSYKEDKMFKKSDFKKYDLIWFGYLDIFINHYLTKLFSYSNINKCIIAVHDPLELFPQQKNWKNEDINLKKWWRIYSWYRWARLQMLLQVKHVVTTSDEMQLIIQKYGIYSHLLPTTSSLPLKKKVKIVTNKCSLLSVYEKYPRKNIEMIESIQDNCKDLKIEFNTKVGKKILSSNQYIKLIDDHEVYICTSYQEGGPLPAMDAMQRGSVVITTPVGQIQNIIKDGENGFLCNTKNEFLKKIQLLSNDLNLLHKMRIKSIDKLSQLRNSKHIKNQAFLLIENILSIEDGVVEYDKAEYKLMIKWMYLKSIYYIYSKYSKYLNYFLKN